MTGLTFALTGVVDVRRRRDHVADRPAGRVIVGANGVIYRYRGYELIKYPHHRAREKGVMGWKATRGTRHDPLELLSSTMYL